MTEPQMNHEDRDAPPGAPLPDMKRRWFLQWSFFGLVLTATGLAANIVIRYLMPTPAKLRKSQSVTLPVSQVPKGAAATVQYQNQPVLVIHTDQGITAFNATCTHLGCLVKWVPEEGEFICPCHAGKFSATGKVLGGPPPEPLHRVDIEIKDEQIRFL